MSQHNSTVHITRTYTAMHQSIPPPPHLQYPLSKVFVEALPYGSVAVLLLPQHLRCLGCYLHQTLPSTSALPFLLLSPVCLHLSVAAVLLFQTLHNSSSKCIVSSTSPLLHACVSHIWHPPSSCTSIYLLASPFILFKPKKNKQSSFFPTTSAQ